MPPPVRSMAADYHFYAYDFAVPAGAQPWDLSGPARNGLSFYSMVRDLAGLAAFATANGVPNVVLGQAGVSINADGARRTIPVLSFGGPTVLGMTPEVLITGGIHAREWVAPAMAYLLAEYLIVNYPPAIPRLTRYQKKIRDLVNSRRIHIIPVVNPHGLNHTIYGADNDARGWRRNRHVMPNTGAVWNVLLRDATGQANPPFTAVAVNAAGDCSYNVPRYQPDQRIPPNPPAPTDYDNYVLVSGTGVDICRNFRTPAWGFNTPGNDNSATVPTDTYFGTEASAETEARNIEAFLRRRTNLRTSIDYHAYGMLVLYPTEAGFGGKLDRKYRRLGEVVRRLTVLGLGGRDDYRVGNPIDLIRYHATGTLADYAALEMNSRAFVVELDPALDQEGVGFNLPETAIRSAFEKNIRGALALIASAGVARSGWSSIFGPTIDAAESEFLNWDVVGRGNRLPQ